MRYRNRWLNWASVVALLQVTVSQTLWSSERVQAPSRASEAYAELPGVRLWYRDSGGTGAAVVFIHAATGSSQVWEHQFPAFTSAGYRVVAYDRRGYGRSAIDPTGSQPGTGADDLLGLVDRLKIERFNLVGTAAGGGIALDFALSFPQRLRSLVIANAVGGIQDREYLELGQRIRPAPQFDALPPDVRELGPSYRAANPGGTQRWLELERTSRSAGAPAGAEPNHLRIAGTDHGSHAAADRGRGLVRPSGGAQVIRGSNQKVGIRRPDRGRSFGILGATGEFQQNRTGLHSQALEQGPQ
jgi:pimeloyl-ACP methyl ester carboxylesterase